MSKKKQLYLLFTCSENPTGQFMFDWYDSDQVLCVSEWPRLQMHLANRLTEPASVEVSLNINGEDRQVYTASPADGKSFRFLRRKELANLYNHPIRPQLIEEEEWHDMAEPFYNGSEDDAVILFWFHGDV